MKTLGGTSRCPQKHTRWTYVQTDGSVERHVPGDLGQEVNAFNSYRSQLYEKLTLSKVNSLRIFKS
jgi:hypothetical protein